MQPNNSDRETLSGFVSVLVSRVSLYVSAVCVLLGIVWSLFFLIRLVLSLYRNRNVPEVKGEINILKKAVSLTTTVQNLLLFFICGALTLLFYLSISLGSYCKRIFNISECDKFERNLHFLIVYYGSGMVLAGLISGIFHILLISYISAFSAMQSQSHVKPHMVVLTLFAAFAMLGFTIPFVVLYTSFVVLIALIIHSFVICYKMYQLDKLLLKCQIKTTGLSRGRALFCEIRCYRLESNFLAIPICAFHFVAILLFACSTALSTKLILFVIESHTYCDQKLRVDLFQNLSTLEFVLPIVSIVLSLVVIIPGVAYTVYFVAKGYKLLTNKDLTTPLNEPLIAQ